MPNPCYKLLLFSHHRIDFSKPRNILSYYVHKPALVPAILTAIVAIRQRKIGVIKSELRGSEFNLNSLMMILICFIFVLSSYFLVLFVGPHTGLMSGDVKSYMNVANEVANFGPFVRSPTNVWSSFFMWLTGYVTDLPLIYAYVGLQFYQLIFPLSFYFLLRTLFPERQKIASIGTLFLIFINGVTSLFMLFSVTSMPNVFETYMNGDVFSALSVMFDKTGAPGIAPLTLGTGSFDTALVFLALAFAYKYLTDNAGSFRNLLLVAVFTGAAFFTHNINFVPIVFGAVIIFSLLHETPRKRLGKLLISIFAIILLLDPLSRFLLGSIWLPWFFLPISENYAYIKAVAILLTLLGACAFFIVFRQQTIRRLGRVFTRLSHSFSKHKAIDIPKVTILLWCLGIFVFLLSIYVYFSNFASIDYVSIWNDSYLTFPWYYIIFRNYGTVFPLAIGSLSLAVAKSNRRPMFFVLGCFLSMLLLVFASIMLPSVLLPNIVNVRMAGFMLIVLSIIAALSFEGDFIEKIKRYKTKTRIAIKYLVPVLLIFSMSISFLSQVYARETFYVPSHQAISQEISDAVEWLNNNVPKATSILPLSESSYTTINNFASHLRSLPVFVQYSPTWLSYSWLRTVLLESESSETILYTLSALGVSYIFATNSDISELRQASNKGVMLSLLNGFPVAYKNNDVTVYTVPEYPLYENSNYRLVIPTLDGFYGSVSNNVITAFNMLTIGGIKFSIENDADLSELKSGYVYIFPSNQHLPQHIINGSLTELRNNGATVIFMDSQFSSFDELNLPTNLNLITQSKDVTSANTSSVQFVDGIAYSFENVTVNPSYRAKASQQILAYYHFADGSRTPYVLYEPSSIGSLFFIDAPLMQGISNVTLYQGLLQQTFAVVKKLLPPQTVSGESLKLPYSNDLFKYIVPHLLGLRFLEGLHNTIICYNNSQIRGNITLTSDNIFLFNEYLPVEKIILRSPSGDYTIENSTLHNLTVKGPGTLSAAQASMEIINSPSGPFAVVAIGASESSELSYSNAELTLEAEINGEKNSLHLLNSSVTIMLKDALKMLVKRPTIMVEGVFSSSLQGVILHDGLFFYVPQEYSNNTLGGRFSLDILYSSGFLYTKIVEIKELTIIEDT